MKNNPYVGPRPYERGERDNFFGRKRETRDLLSLILAERAVLFYAQSGAGKTSLLNAQVIPALEEEGFDVLPVVRVGSALPPGIDPQEVQDIFVYSVLVGLAEAMPAGEIPPDTLTRRTLLSFLRQLCLPEEDVPGDRPPLLVLDQFEEIFTAHRQRWADAQGFFEQLQEALRELPSLGVVFAMREDHVAEMDPYVHLMPRRLRTRFRMERLGYAGALEAVTKPAARADCPFDPAAAERLVNNLRRIKTQRLGGPQDTSGEVVLGPYVEPVQLQVVCNRLWENLPDSERSVIQWQDVQEFGNIDRALTDFYEGALTQTVQETDVGERKLRRWFSERLITPMQSRGLALREAYETAGLPNAAVDLLEGQHLIRADVRAGGRWYELVHDRLVAPIVESNQAWEAEHQTPLRLAAQQWQEAGEDPGILYRGKTLRDALAWAEVQPSELESFEQEFLKASHDAERVRARNRILIILGAVSAVLIIIVISYLAWTAERSRSIADRQRNRATIRQLVAQSGVERDVHPQRSLLLALEALRIAQDTDQELVAIAEDNLRYSLANAGGRVLRGHQEPVRVVAVSPNSRWLVTGGDDATAFLWSLSDVDQLDTTRIALQEHDRAIRAAAFSHDDRWLVTGSDDATARLWDLTAPDPAAASIVLLGHDQAVQAVAFSPDGHWVVSGSGDATARVWDLTATDPAAVPVVLSGHTGAINAVAVSADNHWLVTASDDNTARLWDLTAHDPSAEPVVLRAHRDRVWTAAFSPDDRWLATGSVDATARLWDLSAPDPAATDILLRGHEEWVWSVAFTADNRWLVTSSVDAKPRLWDLTASDPGADSIVLCGHSDQIWSIAISSDSRWLVTAGRDTTARLWDLSAPDQAAASVVLRGHESAINAVAVSDDNRWVVTGSDDETARLWGLTTPESRRAPIVLRGHTGVVRTAEISADEHWLVTSSGDGTARVWDLTDREPAASPIVLRGHEGALHGAIISPDSRWVATGSQDATARLWDLKAPSVADLYIVLEGHKSNVRALDFSPDNHWLVTGSRDGTARLWDLTAPDPNASSIQLPATRTAQIRVVAFSPDSHWLVIGGDDGSPRLWRMTDAVTAAPPTLLRGHTADIRTVAFSPDNRWLVTGGSDTVPRLWDLSAPDPSATSIELLRPGLETGVIRHAKFSPDGRWLVTGSADNTAILWDFAEPGSPVVDVVLRGHNDEIRSVAFSPDGRSLLTASEDGTARLWDLASPNPDEGSMVLPGHVGPVWYVGFSTDGEWIATGGQDGTARLWHRVLLDEAIKLACDIAGRNLSNEEWEQFLGDVDHHTTCPDLATDENLP